MLAKGASHFSRSHLFSCQVVGTPRVELRWLRRAPDLQSGRNPYPSTYPFERMTGIEPAVSCMASKLSTLENHPHIHSSPHPELHRDYLFTKQVFCC